MTDRCFCTRRAGRRTGGSFSWFIESADNYLDPEATMLVRGLWPDFRDQVGPVTVSVAGRFHPQDANATTAVASMAPGDAKADLLISARLFRLRFAGESAPTGCRIGKPTFDATFGGKF